MNIAYPLQKSQDWLTQQWVIIWGRRIEPKEYQWLMGPFGELGTIDDEFVYQLAKKENLIVKREVKSKGLLTSINQLELSESDYKVLSEKVIDFYENTSNYNLDLNVKWNPFFRLFAILINKLFSNRINQLNIPTKNIKNSEKITSEIITLTDLNTNEVKYTIWYRTSEVTKRVIYSGVYSSCILSSGEACVKAVFPLPKGNATVIMRPSVGKNGELLLKSDGQKFGEPGFYFLLRDFKSRYWSQYIRSFKDYLKVGPNGSLLSAEQVLTLWNFQVLKFNYSISRKLLE